MGSSPTGSTNLGKQKSVRVTGLTTRRSWTHRRPRTLTDFHGRTEHMDQGTELSESLCVSLLVRVRRCSPVCPCERRNCRTQKLCWGPSPPPPSRRCRRRTRPVRGRARFESGRGLTWVRCYGSTSGFHPESEGSTPSTHNFVLQTPDPRLQALPPPQSFPNDPGAWDSVLPA